MKKMIGNLFFGFLRLLLSMRYRVQVKGQNCLKGGGAKLILPNHQALIDPFLLYAHTYHHTPAVPVLTSAFYDLPVARWIFKMWQAVRVSDLESKSKNVGVLDQVTSAVIGGLRESKSIVLYPAGQTAAQGYERIINKQSAHRVVLGMPEQSRVIAVRIRGLWGSRWSRAWIGRAPAFFPTLLRCILWLIGNLIFFMPRRVVKIEYIDVTEDVKRISKEGKQAFNSYLEQVYNVYGEEQVNYVRSHFLSLPVKRRLPEHIEGSEESLNSTVNSTVEIPEQVFNEVKSCIIKVLEVDEVKLDDLLVVDLGADSLNIVELLGDVERCCPQFIAPQVRDIRTVRDVCLAAMGELKGQHEMKPSTLHLPLKDGKSTIRVCADSSILKQFITTFTKDGDSPFCYDTLLGSTSRKTFFLKACVVAEFLKQRTQERHVGILLPALQSSTLLIAACYIAGKVPVMLNWTVGKKVLQHCIDSVGVSVILSAGTFVDKISEQLPREVIERMVLLEKEVPHLSLKIKLKGALKARFPRLFIQTKNKPETAVILFTSGSEALPKAVPLTHRNVVSDLSFTLGMLKLEKEHIFLSFLPPFHSFGFTALSIMPLVTGVKIGYTPNPTDAGEVLRLAKHIEANILIGTPSFLKMLLTDKSSAAYSLKSIKYIVSGAESMPLSLKEELEKVVAGSIILEGYGITECSPILTLNPLEKQKIGSVGVFLPGVKAKILHVESDKEVAQGESGMLYVRGDNVFNGYIHAPDQQPFKEIAGESYYKTGDLGYCDEEGYFFITGRLKRFIKVAGEMISMPFIEELLLEKYGDAEVRNLAIEGSDSCNPVRLTLFCTNDINLNDANAYLLERGVSPIAKIRELIHVDEIPLLGTGKVDYKVLKEQLQ